MQVVSLLLLALLLLVVPSTSAPAPQRRRPGGGRGGRNGNGNGQTAQASGGAATNAANPGVNAAFDGTPVGTVKTGTATDGSTILDKTVVLKYVSFSELSQQQRI